VLLIFSEESALSGTCPGQFLKKLTLEEERGMLRPDNWNAVMIIYFPVSFCYVCQMHVVCWI